LRSWFGHPIAFRGWFMGSVSLDHGRCGRSDPILANIVKVQQHIKGINLDPPPSIPRLDN
jgi:hypothetical protein